jgi:ergothioneine biosynthesis protein EgtB
MIIAVRQASGRDCSVVSTRIATGQGIQALYERIRRVSVELCAPLETEDYVIQTMPDVSPPKWHLAHTTWFFETFILSEFVGGYEPVNPAYRILFNSYYNAAGDKHPRPERGFLSRPTVEEVLGYRHRIDSRMLELLNSMKTSMQDEILRRAELGLHHEQQHQELLLMDIKYNLSVNPLRPAYKSAPARAAEQSAGPAPPVEWLEFEPGVQRFGDAGDGFAYDNEAPRHAAYLAPFAIASRCVTNGEYMEFIEAGGYRRPEHWLSDGWSLVQRESWSAPLYWEKQEGRWREFTLSGMRDVEEQQPVVHVSYFEADAFARWKKRRLPTELEWEHAARRKPVDGNFLESGTLHPRAAAGEGLQQAYGDVWEVTSSDYGPYPGYTPEQGSLGEYNGKFMCGQYVQRGGSCVSPRSHLRATYRNYYYPHQRWNFQGVRLASGTSGA